MLCCKPGKPTKIKNKIYLCASTILGILLSLIVYALFELNYLDWANSQGQYPDFQNDYLFLSFFIILGAIGGFFLGKFWWRKVYIEKAWAKKKRKK